MRMGRAELVDKVMDALGLDAVCTTNEGEMLKLAGICQCPNATVPAGYLAGSGRPFGIGFIARPHGEETLLRLMAAFEATFPARRLPPCLV